MEFSIKTASSEKQHHHCLIVGVYESQQLSAAAEALDKLSSGYITMLLKRGDLDGKLEKTLMLHDVPNVPSERVLLVGLGKREDFSEKKFAKAARASIKALSGTAATEALSYLADLPVNNLSVRRKTALLVEMAIDATYRFEAIKRKKQESPTAHREAETAKAHRG